MCPRLRLRLDLTDFSRPRRLVRDDLLGSLVWRLVWRLMLSQCLSLRLAMFFFLGSLLFFIA